MAPEGGSGTPNLEAQFNAFYDSAHAGTSVLATFALVGTPDRMLFIYRLLLRPRAAACRTER